MGKLPARIYPAPINIRAPVRIFASVITVPIGYEARWDVDGATEDAFDGEEESHGGVAKAQAGLNLGNYDGEGGVVEVLETVAPHQGGGNHHSAGLNALS